MYLQCSTFSSPLPSPFLPSVVVLFSNGCRQHYDCGLSLSLVSPKINIIIIIIRSRSQQRTVALSIQLDHRRLSMLPEHYSNCMFW